jgi:AraC-like DNA-binding protein
MRTARWEINSEDLPMTRTKSFFAPKVRESGTSEVREIRPSDIGNTNGHGGSPGSNIDQRIAIVIEFMIASPMKSISVESVAALLSLSPSRLRHLFKEQVGIPMHKYEVMLRLERVRLLLRTTDCSVKETARMLGFVDMSNFNHMFKRAYGVTPGAVRGERA